MQAVHQRAFHQRMQRWAAHESLIKAMSIFKGNTDLTAAGRRWPTVTCLTVWAGSNPRASEENGALASVLCGDLSPQASCCKETFQLSVSKPSHFLVSTRRPPCALFKGKMPVCSGDGSILRHQVLLLFINSCRAFHCAMMYGTSPLLTDV